MSSTTARRSASSSTSSSPSAPASAATIAPTAGAAGAAARRGGGGRLGVGALGDLHHERGRQVGDVFGQRVGVRVIFLVGPQTAQALERLGPPLGVVGVERPPLRVVPEVGEEAAPGAVALDDVGLPVRRVRLMPLLRPRAHAPAALSFPRLSAARSAAEPHRPEGGGGATRGRGPVIECAHVSVFLPKLSGADVIFTASVKARWRANIWPGHQTVG